MNRIYNTQLHYYRLHQLPWATKLDADTTSRIRRVLERHLGPIVLPQHADPHPFDWPIDRSSLNKAVKEFLRLTDRLGIQGLSSTDPGYT